MSHVHDNKEQEVIKTMDISHNAFQWEAANHSQCCKMTISLSKVLPQNGCQYQCIVGKNLYFPIENILIVCCYGKKYGTLVAMVGNILPLLLW